MLFLTLQQRAGEEGARAGKYLLLRTYQRSSGSPFNTSFLQCTIGIFQIYFEEMKYIPEVIW